VTALKPLASVRADDIEKLLDDAFGKDRHQRTAYKLRRGMPTIDHLSFAVVDGQSLIGTIQCWPIAVDAAPLILVGPVAVPPPRQHQGIGHMLMHAALGAARPNDPPMAMIGDAEYYARFGFVADQTGGWSLPGPWDARRLLLRNPEGRPLPVRGMLGPRSGL
jgi:predicted N-acetyltransferase YhbS